MQILAHYPVRSDGWFKFIIGGEKGIIGLVVVGRFLYQVFWNVVRRLSLHF